MSKKTGRHIHNKDNKEGLHTHEDDDEFKVSFKGDVKDMPSISVSKEPQKKKQKTNKKARENKQQEIKKEMDNIEKKFNSFELTKQMLQQATGDKIPIFIEDFNQPVGNMPAKKDINEMNDKIDRATNNLRQFSMRAYRVDIADLLAQNRQNQPPQPPPQPPQPPQQPELVRGQPIIEEIDQDDDRPLLQPQQLRLGEPQQEQLSIEAPQPNPLQQLLQEQEFQPQEPEPEPEEDRPLLLPQQKRLGEPQQEFQPEEQPEEQNFFNLPLEVPRLVPREDATFEEQQDLEPISPSFQERMDQQFNNLKDENKRLRDELEHIKSMELQLFNIEQDLKGEKLKKMEDDELEALFREVEELERLQDQLGLPPTRPDTDISNKELIKKADDIEDLQEDLKEKIDKKDEEQDEEIKDIEEDINELKEIEKKLEKKYAFRQNLIDSKASTEFVDKDIELLEKLRDNIKDKSRQPTEEELIKEFDELKADEEEYNKSKGIEISKKEKLINDFNEVKKVVEEYDKNQAKEKEQDILDEMNENINPQFRFYNKELDKNVDEFDNIKQLLKTTSIIKDKVKRNKFLDRIKRDVRTLTRESENIIRDMGNLKQSISKDTYEKFKNKIEDELYIFYRFNARDLTNRVEVAWRRIDNIENNRNLEDGVDEIKDKIRPQDRTAKQFTAKQFKESTTEERTKLRLKHPIQPPQVYITQLSSLATN